MLGMKEVKGTRDGENFAEFVLSMLQSYEIGNRLGYFVMNNTSINTQMVKLIAQDLKEKDQTLYNVQRRRLQCNGYVIDLAIKAFLFGKMTDTIQHLEQSTGNRELPTPEELQKWRNIGPLGKLHNVFTFICKTPQHQQRFRQFSGGISLCQRNAIDWNSWYDMLYCALYKAKVAVTSYIAENNALETDSLSTSDWITLQHIYTFLSSFKDATKATEGRNATIENVSISMDFLINQFEVALDEFKSDRFMMASLHAGYEKMLEYFDIKSRNPAFIAAVVLNPSLKWTVYNHWEHNDRQHAKKSLNDLWQQEYCIATGMPNYSKPERETDNQFLQWMFNIKESMDPNKDELERYLDEGRVALGTSSPLKWWCSPTNRTRFPLLSRMAIDILSIPAMSSEAERIFSGTRRIISDT